MNWYSTIEDLYHSQSLHAMETSLKDEAPMIISAPLSTVSLSAIGKTDEFLDVISCDDLQLSGADKNRSGTATVFC